MLSFIEMLILIIFSIPMFFGYLIPLILILFALITSTTFSLKHILSVVKNLWSNTNINNNAPVSFGGFVGLEY